MPTFLLLLVVLAGRLLFALARGVAYVVLLPARTALALAPHTGHARWMLAGGVTATLALAAGVLTLMLGGAR